MEIKHKLDIYIQSQKAEAVPPLGTVLGNLGVNATNFCKDFNNFTSELPAYFTLSVTIYIYANRSYKFSVKEPNLGTLLNLLIENKEYKQQGKTIIQPTIKLRSLIELALWKFNKLPLKKSLPILLGSVKAAKLFIQI